MSQLNLTTPLVFEPIFQERSWGGRRLETAFGKKLPAEKRIGESWEIVDRPEAQSIVARGPLKGKTLHELWTEERSSIFGEVHDAPRFPLLIKLLDAHDRLSLQVHPPVRIARKLGGEPKTEFWYVAAADYAHKVRVKPGDIAFLPAGRLHAISSGNLLIEIQQNSDTTYRVFDWNRVDDNGKLRELHIEQALQCIDFNDVAPKLVEPQGELLVRHKLFEVQKWNLTASRDISSQGQFAIVCCLTGSLRC